MLNKLEMKVLLIYSKAKKRNKMKKLILKLRHLVLQTKLLKKVQKLFKIWPSTLNFLKSSQSPEQTQKTKLEKEVNLLN